MKYILFIILSLLFNSLSFAQSLRPSSETNPISHTYYSLEYAEEHEQAKWVFYKLTKENIYGQATRKNNFKSDPLISTASSFPNEYRGSGYDRGHLCPAAAMKQNQVAMNETFYMSNMSPQVPGLNRGKWKNLEALVRTWAIQEKILYVVTGGILNKSLKKIPNTNISIPNYFYKVIYDPTDEKKIIAFILPNTKIENNLASYQVSVDEVERRTGIDFFSALEDGLEENLESTMSRWKFRNPKKVVHAATIQPKNNRCQANTKKGSQCKRSPSSSSKFCWQHGK